MSEGIPKSRFQTETEKKWADTKDEALRDNAALDEAQRKIAEIIKDSEEIPATVSDESRGARMTFEDVEKLFGKDFLGAQAVEQVFGTSPETIPDIPFSKEGLERAKELGQQLIYQSDVMNVKDPETGTLERNVPVTPANLEKYFTKAHDGGRVFYDQNWYDDENFFKKERPRKGWRLTSKDLVPGSTNKSYLEQTEALIEYLSNEVFKGTKLPKQYKDAIVKFARELPKITSLHVSNWKNASRALVNLQITKLTRELSVEVMYRLILNDHTNKIRLIRDDCTWTASRTSDGGIVGVGSFDRGGMDVNDDGSGIHDLDVGVSFSRGS